jgi:hypothetical protein
MAEKSTLRKVVDTVKEVAANAVQAAETHVVRPVGKAVGLVKKEPTKQTRKALNKSKRKAIAQAVAGRRKQMKRDLASSKRANPVM